LGIFLQALFARGRILGRAFAHCEFHPKFGQLIAVGADKLTA